jgi:hypothetical protein
MAEHQALNPELPSKLIHQFPLPTWIENIAVRSNGDLLVTLLTTPELYLINPFDSKEAILVHKFDEVLALTGIIEIKEDIFYVGGGNFNLSTFSNEHGSYKIWEIDMTGFTKGFKPPIKQVAHLTDAGLANGFELLSKDAGNILVADSEVGAVWKVNVNDGAVEKVITLDEMKPPPPPAMQMGINGLGVRDNYLYWSNTAKQLFCRIKIDEGGKPVDAVEILERDLLIDDFCFDKRGNAWVTEHGLNVLGVVKSAGGVVVAAGSVDKLTVAGGTACQFGRTTADADILYFVTTGGMSAPVNGSEVEGGKVVAIDTAKYVH